MGVIDTGIWGEGRFELIREQNKIFIYPRVPLLLPDPLIMNGFNGLKMILIEMGEMRYKKINKKVRRTPSEKHVGFPGHISNWSNSNGREKRGEGCNEKDPLMTKTKLNL